MKTKEKNHLKTDVATYTLYNPRTQRLTYIKGNKPTGGLLGPVAERTFYQLLGGETEIRIQP